MENKKKREKLSQQAKRGQLRNRKNQNLHLKKLKKKRQPPQKSRRRKRKHLKNQRHQSRHRKKLLLGLQKRKQRLYLRQLLFHKLKQLRMDTLRIQLLMFKKLKSSKKMLNQPNLLLKHMLQSQLTLRMTQEQKRQSRKSNRMPSLIQEQIQFNQLKMSKLRRLKTLHSKMKTKKKTVMNKLRMMKMQEMSKMVKPSKSQLTRSLLKKKKSLSTSRTLLTKLKMRQTKEKRMRKLKTKKKTTRMPMKTTESIEIKANNFNGKLLQYLVQTSSNKEGSKSADFKLRQNMFVSCILHNVCHFNLKRS